MGFLDSLASIPASIITSVANTNMSREANAATSKEASMARDHDRDMADTAHQREVKDLKAAGLNPVLSAGGNGAGGGNSPSPTHQAPQLPNIDWPMLMIQNEQLRQAQEKIDVDKANSAAGIAKSLSETELNKMKKILAQKGMIRADLEGEASGVLKNIIKFFKESARKPDLKKFNEFNFEQRELEMQTRP